MSESQCSELVTTFFTVNTSAFGILDRKVHVRVNELNRDLIELTVGSIRICTQRANWAAIFRAFTETLGSEVVEITLPGHKVQFAAVDK